MSIDILDFVTPTLFNLDDGPLVITSSSIRPHPQWDARFWDTEDFPAYYQRRRRPIIASPSVGLPPQLVWDGITNLEVRWGLHYCEGTYEMYQHRQPIREDTPQLLRYTFRDQYSEPISLSGYVAVFVLAKREGVIYNTATAEFEDAATGKVKYSLYTFADPGIWNIQFVCVDVSGRKLSGDPAQIKVVENVDTVALDKLLQY